MFGFDERFAMFDITPVENQFILEYLPGAKGDYVKVYLYGLMRCYHPEEDMSPARMSHELNMTEDEIAAAFRYWERKGLVRRVSDNPPRWQYVNILQKNLGGDNEPADPDYEEFSNAVYEAFDKVRRLHGSELSECFEWKEDMNLPTEVIIMLLNHMAEIKGKNFRISDAGKVAAQMAGENVRSVEAAEEFFSRDEKAYAGIKKVLKKLGKYYSPSEAQVNLYRKWTREWHFSHEAIEAILLKMDKTDPNLGYVDRVLEGLLQQYGDGEGVTKEKIQKSFDKRDGMKEVLKELGKTDNTPQDAELYDQMIELYPQSIILIAARECGARGRDTEGILELLKSWKERGLESIKNVKDYVNTFHDQSSLIMEIKQIWGIKEKSSQVDRSLVSKWQNEFGFKREMILAVAPYASDAKQPMKYLDKILIDCYEKGITTPDAVRKENDNKKAVTSIKGKERKVSAQDYDQRDYTEVQKQMMETQRKKIEERMKRNGGQSDA